jgi:signal peptidase I
MNDDTHHVTDQPLATPAPPPQPQTGLKEWWNSLFAAEPARPPDIVREIFETVVFVVVLVLLLKSFAAEAFVIPTGSMATTLLGYNKQCKCPMCGTVQPVNCSDEVEKGTRVDYGVCQNCHYRFTMSEAGNPTCSTGDRVLVAKYFYDGPFASNSEAVRGIAAILAILAAALLGGNAAGKLLGWLRRRRDTETHPRRLLLPIRVVGAVICALVVAYCAFGTGPAVANTAPARFDVVVFKYPVAPQQGYTPTNYIKRLVGKPGETIAIKAGKLYVLAPGILPTYTKENEVQLELNQDQIPHLPVTLNSQEAALPEDEQQKVLHDKLTKKIEADLPDLLWHRIHMHINDSNAVDLFNEGKFQIIRKPPQQILSMMRLVYDNDHPPSDLNGPQYERWRDANGTWTASGRGFSGKGAAGATNWLRYQHLIPGTGVPNSPRSAVHKRLISDVLSYNNNGINHGGYENDDPWNQTNWVSDLILEFDANIENADGQFTIELSKGKDRFRARWELASGKCTVYRVDENQNETELDHAATSLKGKGTRRRLRFANVDDRLTIWVDSTLPFRGPAHAEGGVDNDKVDLYIKPTRNDFEPASIGLTGDAAVNVANLKLFRDTYYTNFFPVRPPSGQDLKSTGPVSFEEPPDKDEAYEDWQRAWEKQMSDLNTMYVQPGHYLCMGDNSSHSADSRSWGLVPQRLMLGRALVVYWPIGRVGMIR